MKIVLLLSAVGGKTIDIEYDTEDHQYTFGDLKKAAAMRTEGANWEQFNVTILVDGKSVDDNVTVSSMYKQIAVPTTKLSVLFNRKPLVEETATANSSVGGGTGQVSKETSFSNFTPHGGARLIPVSGRGNDDDDDDDYDELWKGARNTNIQDAAKIAADMAVAPEVSTSHEPIRQHLAQGVSSSSSSSSSENNNNIQDQDQATSKPVEDLRAAINDLAIYAETLTKSKREFVKTQVNTLNIGLDLILKGHSPSVFLTVLTFLESDPIIKKSTRWETLVENIKRLWQGVKQYLSDLKQNSNGDQNKRWYFKPQFFKPHMEIQKRVSVVKQRYEDVKTSQLKRQ